MLALSRGEDALDLAHDLAPPAREVVGDVVENEEARQDGVRMQPDVVVLRSRLDRLVEEDVGPGELADLHERLAQHGQECKATLVLGRKELGGPPEEVRRGRHVAPAEGALPGRGETRRRPHAELTPVVVQGPEICQVPVRLLEVVAEDLLVLGLAVAVAVDALGPSDEPLVQGNARPLEDAGVRRVADEQVVEAECARATEA